MEWNRADKPETLGEKTAGSLDSGSGSARSSDRGLSNAPLGH